MPKKNLLLGTLYIISAPSGGGKTSLVHALLKTMPNIEVSVSHTTRNKRPSETHGTNYYFISEAEFKKQIASNVFLEYAEVFGSYYGTSREWVEEKLRLGTDVILEIDWQGAHQIKSLFPECVSIFILPPSREILAQRLRERGQDDEAVIKKRLAEARAEISHYQEFDYLVVNDEFSHAVADLAAIIQSHRLKLKVQAVKYAELLKNLLQ